MIYAISYPITRKFKYLPISLKVHRVLTHKADVPPDLWDIGERIGAVNT
jgi:hypothetical protein